MLSTLNIAIIMLSTLNIIPLCCPCSNCLALPTLNIALRCPFSILPCAVYAQYSLALSTTLPCAVHSQYCLVLSILNIALCCLRSMLPCAVHSQYIALCCPCSILPCRQRKGILLSNANSARQYNSALCCPAREYWTA